MPDFKDRYVLGEGYPDLIHSSKYGDTVRMCPYVDGGAGRLRVPKYLQDSMRMPRYRLVLERVKE